MHFSCLVVGDDVDAVLAPFSEHLETPPTRRFLDPEDVARMSAHFDIPAGDLESLSKKLPDWEAQDGGVQDGRLFVWTTENPRSKWDWYERGGRFGPFLQLRTPRQPPWWLSWVRSPATHTTRARKREILPDPLLLEPPAAVLFGEEWHESPLDLASAGNPAWQAEFADVFARIPDDAFLNAMDLHS